MLKELFASFLFPTEISAMFKLKYGSQSTSSITYPTSLSTAATQLSSYEFCYAALNKVSRSFAMVIQQLPLELRDSICIFYLTLRGLDSVEDDMTYDTQSKDILLRDFYLKLNENDWSIEGVGDSPDYRILLANFEKVLHIFHTLTPNAQDVIKDITKKMGAGMAYYAKQKSSIDSWEDYNKYCHYVAGLVGVGLSELFSLSGLEDNELRLETKLSNSMGLFLQKTNIIRDYLEDVQEGRTWWPAQIWSAYGNSLECFADAPNSDISLAVLNHMVTDALNHVPDCMEYLKRLKDRSIFEFCAIPQVMAIATLTEVYNNPNVLRRNVKIRKGLSCKLMLESTSLEQVYGWFRFFIDEILRKAPKEESADVRKRRELICNFEKNGKNTSSSSTQNVDSVINSLYVIQKLTPPQRVELFAEGHPDYLREITTKVLKKIERGTVKTYIPGGSKIMKICNSIAWLVFFCCTYYLLTRLRGRGADELDNDSDGILFGMGIGSGADLLAVLTCFASVGYLFGFFGIQYV